MKKILIAVLALAAISLAACSTNGGALQSGPVLSGSDSGSVAVSTGVDSGFAPVKNTGTGK